VSSPRLSLFLSLSLDVSLSLLQRAATRANLVKNLRNAAQALAALQVRQRQQSAAMQAGGAMGAVEGEGGVVPPLIKGDTEEARAVCLALEQCLFHRIRVKEFGERGGEHKLAVPA